MQKRSGTMRAACRGQQTTEATPEEGERDANAPVKHEAESDEKAEKSDHNGHAPRHYPKDYAGGADERRRGLPIPGVNIHGRNKRILRPGHREPFTLEQ
jgi:hypothetical protein